MASNLSSRAESAINVAKRWDSDKSLLAEIRASIPMKDLVPELVCETEARWKLYMNKFAVDGGVEAGSINGADGMQYKTSYFRDDDGAWEGDDLLLKRLTLYFKQDVMVWCNQPPCCNPNCTGNEDGKQMDSTGTRGPQTKDEKTGGASRVEVYACQLCKAETTFPRYNSPRTLFKTRRGRCGEFANLFGAYCRALGFDTRYILDFTDHVWTEVWSMRQQRWLHADSCEGLIDRPNMYEQGWGKKLSYVIGATNDSVADVTKRYTRKFYTDEFQARRREFAPDEVTSDSVIVQLGRSLSQTNTSGKSRLDELEKRSKAEGKYFNLVQSSGVWDVEYREGRISGSLVWKAARRELGDGNIAKEEENNDRDEKGSTQSFLVESFYPPAHQQDLTIVVRPPVPSNVPSIAPKSHLECIIVNGIACAAASKIRMSVVIVDETSGCILHSKSFSTWVAVGKFLDCIHSGRIVALCGIRGEENNIGSSRDNQINVSTTNNFRRLGGFNIDSSFTTTESFVLFVGQLNFHPDWATSICTSNIEQAIKVILRRNTSTVKIRLRSETHAVPATVSTRLPDPFMPLQDQLVASNAQKRTAFNKFIEAGSHNNSVTGYATKPGAPIYLIDDKSYPFRSSGEQPMLGSANYDPSWVTHHFLPESLVPDDDFIDDSKQTHNISNSAPKFDIQIADDYFTGLLGNQLLVKNDSSAPTLVDTAAALSNSRLIALYFSAHWCGPCRGFTPMLIEFYSYIQAEVAPMHGMKIVFVSSDRDEEQFQAYYRGMSFLALPFSQRVLAQHAKTVFGVRGIPFLVIIDSLSGRIVQPPAESRRDVHHACQQGEDAIEKLFGKWLDSVPDETKSILDVLALSCQDEESLPSSKQGERYKSKVESYLFRMSDPTRDENYGERAASSVDISARVKEIFSELVATGMDPNSAAAEAIKQTTTEQKDSMDITRLETGTLIGTSEVYVCEGMSGKLCELNKSDIKNVLAIAKRYLVNAQKDPSNPRFRSFRLGNKVADQITSTPGGVAFLTDLGFSVFHSDDDFVATIPLTVNLEAMADVFDNLINTSM